MQQQQHSLLIGAVLPRPKRSFAKTVLLMGLLLAAAVCLFESRGSASPISGSAAVLGNRTADVRFAEDVHEAPAPASTRRRRGTGPVKYQPTHLLTWMLSFSQLTPQQEAFDALANEFAEQDASAHEQEHNFDQDFAQANGFETVGALVARPGALRASAPNASGSGGEVKVGRNATEVKA